MPHTAPYEPRPRYVVDVYLGDGPPLGCYDYFGTPSPHLLNETPTTMFPGAIRLKIRRLPDRE